MSGAFERLAKSVLRRLGADALLISGATTTPCRVHIAHGVQMTGPFNDAVFERDVATFDKAEVSPRVGDELQHPDGNYTLDGLVRDNGTTVKFSLQVKR